MPELKTTPGPWAVIPAVISDGEDDVPEGAYLSFASIEGADGNPVCVFGDTYGSGQIYENAANAHLIAAAPELYEAGRALRETQKAYMDLRGTGASDQQKHERGQAVAKAAAVLDAALAKARGETA